MNNEDSGWKLSSGDEQIKPQETASLQQNSSEHPKRKRRAKNKGLKIFATILISLFFLYVLAFFFGNFFYPSLLSLMLLVLICSVMYLVYRWLWKTPSSEKDMFSAASANKLQRGIVRGFTQGHETLNPKGLRSKYKFNQKIVWHFRVECFDEAGNRSNTIPVKMSGDGFHGAVSDGDMVEVYQEKVGVLLETGMVRNLTSGIVVKAVNHHVPLYSRIGRVAAFTIFIIIFAAVFLYIAMSFMGKIR